MTTKPKGRKFRIRRSHGHGAGHAGTGEAAPAAQSPASSPAPDDTFDDGFGDTPFPGSARADAPQSAGADGATAAPAAEQMERELATIRAEGLTGRQLRMARRIAQRHGLRPGSDFDAVRLLRRQGIDPFQRTNMLELVVDGGGHSAAGRQQQGDPSNLPATVRETQVPGPTAPPPPPDGEADRAREILRVQRDIARRRRRRLALLMVRMAFFVLLPTSIAGYYFYGIATPLYATNSEFVIQKSEAAGGGASGLSGLFGGTSFATVQESVIVQSYLESREAMERLDAELGFRAHFSTPGIDPLNRLAPDATDEDMYDLFSRNLTIGYDPTEGIIKMEMVAADPETSAAFSEALIRYAEERVDQISQRLREDQMEGAMDSYQDAEARLQEAQDRVVSLQEQVGVLSAEAEVSGIMSQVNTFEVQLQEERLRLDELLSNPSPNQTRVEVAERNIARLENLISELRASMTDGAQGSSLASITARLAVAEADLETRQMMVAQSLQQLETARIEANRQSLYLSIGVAPVAPDAPAYPRALENTILAFLVFTGIYLMLSMTASVLREQVTA